jgi:hypothetical protein
MTTILTCSKCSGEGSLYKSKYGGNDPDVWRTGQCDACKGSGNESCALRGCDEKAVTFNDDGEPLCSDCLASTLHLAASSSPGLAVREALSNVRTAILEAPIEVVTDTLWMPERLSKNETVVDYIDSAFSAAGSQRCWVTVIVPSGYKDAAEFVADCGLETVPVSSDHMPKVREVWSASTHDEIIKRLMEQVGMPNSHSLYVAFKQFANELHALAIDALVPGDGVRDASNVETIAALLYEAANPTMKWSYLWPSHNHLHASVRQQYIEAAARFQDSVAQRIEHSEPDEGRKDAGSTPVAVAALASQNEGDAVVSMHGAALGSREQVEDVNHVIGIAGKRSEPVADSYRDGNASSDKGRR